MIRDLRGALGGACLLVPVLIRLMRTAGRASIGTSPAMTEREPTDRGAVL